MLVRDSNLLPSGQRADALRNTQQSRVHGPSLVLEGSCHKNGNTYIRGYDDRGKICRQYILQTRNSFIGQFDHPVGGMWMW